MKKLTFVLLTLVLLTSLTLAQTTTTSTSTISTPKHKPVVPVKKGVVKKEKVKKLSSYQGCVGQKVRELTKEMQSKKKEALNNYRNEIKNATSTTASREVRKNYIPVIRDINKWYNSELRKIKQECKIATTTPTSTPTTSNSTATSTQ
ncbi:MAG: hypothetical protein KatS3mg094_242 [Candidatus Parcubacteria bacterium]|nr:MAG: hypothetical protein KatS3mg094_242 [Candidatus Parcubacteria bacterium]